MDGVKWLLITWWVVLVGFSVWVLADSLLLRWSRRGLVMRKKKVKRKGTVRKGAARSAVSGEFVSREYAEQHPKTTVVERRHRRQGR